ncbi:unnamed protein product [Ambrosiozyma monospora]|uniref:Unnamed protein product n=1 Tax=Ambrosiozyma monospora TaxID=43982 RepID=A0ACB5TAE4_AMBMO|nr:unnamed protein product [Ambrosiozyma monospora]
MVVTMFVNSHFYISALFEANSAMIAEAKLTPSIWDKFVYSISDPHNGFVLDHDGLRGLNFYAYWFYLSKYYEIIDTIVILLKGRPAMFLQTYHHTLAILGMWTGVRFSSPTIWTFVVFNSFIHSIMYTYYALCCLHVKIPIKFKQSLTFIQLVQFVVVASLLVCHNFINYFDFESRQYKNCITDSSKELCIPFNVSFALGLMYLFGRFYIESYKKPQLKKKSKKAD